MKKFAWKKGDFTITPYGYLWGNTVYSTERTSPRRSYTLYVTVGHRQRGPKASASWTSETPGWGLTWAARRSPVWAMRSSGGKVEIDFQTDACSRRENKPTILLRHAYFDVKNDDFRLLVGQTWDVISPLYPGMLLYSVGWDGGNIGYRRAQFRGERFLTFSDTSLVTAQLAVCPQVFSDNTTNTTAGTITGEPSNWPIIEGRVAWTIGQRGQGCLPDHRRALRPHRRTGVRHDPAGPRPPTSARGRATSTSACP